MAESKVVNPTLINSRSSSLNSSNSEISKKSKISDLTFSGANLNNIQIENPQYYSTPGKENVDVETKSANSDFLLIRAPKSSQRTQLSANTTNTHNYQIQQQKLDFSFMQEPPNSLVNSKMNQIGPHPSQKTLNSQKIAFQVEKNTKKIQTSVITISGKSDRNYPTRAQFPSARRNSSNRGLTTDQNMKSNYSISTEKQLNNNQIIHTDQASKLIPTGQKSEFNDERLLLTPNDKGNFKKKHFMNQETPQSLASSKMTFNSQIISEKNMIRKSDYSRSKFTTDLSVSLLPTPVKLKKFEKIEEDEVHYSGEFGRIPTPKEEIKDNEDAGELAQSVESLFDELRSIK